MFKKAVESASNAANVTKDLIVNGTKTVSLAVQMWSFVLKYGVRIASVVAVLVVAYFGNSAYWESSLRKSQIELNQAMSTAIKNGAQVPMVVNSK